MLVAMNAAATLLTVASLILHKEDGVACTMTFTMGIIETVLTVALYCLGAAQLEAASPVPSKKEE